MRNFATNKTMMASKGFDDQLLLFRIMHRQICRCNFEVRRHAHFRNSYEGARNHIILNIATHDHTGDGVTYEFANGTGPFDVPAGGTKTVSFTYRVARPKDWRLSQ